MSPLLILLIAALLGLPSFLRSGTPEEMEKNYTRRPGVKAWWF